VQWDEFLSTLRAFYEIWEEVSLVEKEPTYSLATIGAPHRHGLRTISRKPLKKNGVLYIFSSFTNGMLIFVAYTFIHQRGKRKVAKSNQTCVCMICTANKSIQPGNKKKRNFKGSNGGKDGAHLQQQIGEVGA
jgi:hypothetical protein